MTTYLKVFFAPDGILLRIFEIRLVAYVYIFTRAMLCGARLCYGESSVRLSVHDVGEPYHTVVLIF